MISKNSNAGKADWIASGDEIRHESISKTAMSSFEKVLLASAERMTREGKSTAEIAAAFSMTTEDLEAILAQGGECCVRETTKTASVDEVVVSASAAEEAYYALQPHRKVAASSETIRSGKTLHSATGNQSVSDIGGPAKQIRSQSSNSIWDNGVLDRQLNAKGNDEIIHEAQQADRARREEIKNKSREQTIDPETLKLAMQNESTVSSAGHHTHAHKFSQKLPVRGISIFDTEEFARVPETTSGEKAIAEKKVASAKKPREATSGLVQKQQNSKSIFDSMIESMLETRSKMPTTSVDMMQNLDQSRMQLAELAKQTLGVDLTQLSPQQQNETIKQLQQMGHDITGVGDVVTDNADHLKDTMKQVHETIGTVAQAKPFNLKKAQMMQAPAPAAPPAADPMGGTDPMGDPSQPDLGAAQPDTSLENVSFDSGADVKDWLDQIGDPNKAIQVLSDKYTNSNERVTDPNSNLSDESLSVIKDAVNDFFSSGDEQVKLDAASTLFDTIIPDGEKGNQQLDTGSVPAKFEQQNVAAMVSRSNEAVRKLAQAHAKADKPKAFNLKVAQHKSLENVIVQGPNNHVDQFTGQLINDWHLVERNKGFGLKLPGVYNVDWEKAWRENVMDKYTPSYIEDRFEVDGNIPTGNNLHLAPGETRRVTPPEYGSTESRLEDARTKMNSERGYEPSSKGEVFNWKKASAAKVAGPHHPCGKCFKWKKCECGNAAPESEGTDCEAKVAGPHHPCGKCFKWDECTCEGKKKVTAEGGGGMGSEGLKPLPELKMPGEKTLNTKPIQKCPHCGGTLGDGKKSSSGWCSNCKISVAPEQGGIVTSPADAAIQQQTQQHTYIQKNQLLPTASASDDAGISNYGGVFFDGRNFVCYAKKKKHKFETYEEAEEFKMLKADPKKDPAAYLDQQRAKEPTNFKQLPASPQMNPATMQQMTQHIPSDPESRVHNCHDTADKLGIEG